MHMTSEDHTIGRSTLPSFRDLIDPLYQHRWAALLTFAVVFGGATVGVLLMKPEYEATMKVLVKRERMDPVMTPSANATSQASADVQEDELNSEVEILKSRDLLEQVVIASGLVVPAPGSVASEPPSRADVSRAVSDLQQALVVYPLRRTTLIEATYRSHDPVLAAEVLTNLARLYVEKHLAVHRPAGAHEFFVEQARNFEEQLHQAEARLAEFGRTERVIAPVAERDHALQQLAEFEASAQQAQAAIAEADQRIRTLDSQIATTPSRQTTQILTSENGDLIRSLKAKLLELELSETDLLRKFTPEYPPVKQVQTQIAQIRTALTDAESTPTSAQTTDQNPTHQWLRDERVRVATERNAQNARATALAQSIAEYRAKAQRLDSATAKQEELLRNVKTAQDGYQLYQQKQEETRISDALDRTRIANVSLAEEPTVPTTPARSGRGMMLALAGVVALAASVLTALALYQLNPYFRTADEVQAFLGVPVLATLPSGSK
ncbi:MAG: hypothetical protein GEU82_15695 [Luteitalea sp.]|nr:hypothetical protein [Luteitalea sp.]